MASVDVTFVGSGDAFGSGGRLQTCILVESEDVKICIDFGTTSLVGLRREGIDPNTIDAIVLTHLHGDHCGGVPFFLLDAMLSSKRSAALTIVGPPGTEDHLDKVQDALFPGSLGMTPKFETKYIEARTGSRVTTCGVSISPTEARHTHQTHPTAVKLDIGGLSIAYTGDGELTHGLAELVCGVDLLIAECYFYDKNVKWHLNYTDIASLQAKRIVLTHMHTNMLEHVSAVPEECAHDGYKITI